MKLSDKAIEAALEEGKLWCEGMQLNSPNPAVWKVLRVTNKNGNYKTIKKFNSREERDEALERLRVEAMINAAFATPDLYAATDWMNEIKGFGKGMREWIPIESVKDDEEFEITLSGKEIHALLDARRKARGEC